MTTKSQYVKPRPINLVHQSYQPSKAELEADVRIKGVSFKQAIQALLRPVRIRRMRPNDVDGGQPRRG